MSNAVFGAVLGGLMGSAAAGLRLPLAVHLGISATLFSIVAIVAYRFLLPGPEDAERTAEAQGLAAADGHPAAPPARRPGRPWFTGAAVRMLAALGVLAAMTLGRLSGDRVVNRFGQRTVARAGGVPAAAGMGAALALPSVPAALAGFTLAGLGFATLVPAAMHTADELPGLPAGTGLTIGGAVGRAVYAIRAGGRPSPVSPNV